MNADEQLRRLRQDDRWTDDAPPIRSARGPSSAPRIRRGFVPAIATVVTALVVAAVAGTVLLNTSGPDRVGADTTAAPSSAASVVPWVATTPAPIPTPPSTTATAALCALADLQVGSRQGGTAMGTWRAPVTVTNRSGTACRLTAASLSLQVLSGGRFVTVGATTVQADQSGGFLLKPGTTAHFYGSMGPCSTVRRFSTEVLEPMYLTVAGVRVRLDETVPNDFIPLCAHPDSGSGSSWFDQEDSVPEPVSPYSRLQVSMTVPAVVRAGQVVDYTVTVSNPTPKAIALTPCPSYTQYFAGSASSYVLNCALVPSLAPGRSETFAMKATMPATAHGTVKLSWTLDGGPTATTIRTILN